MQIFGLVIVIPLLIKARQNSSASCAWTVLLSEQEAGVRNYKPAG